jgi:hypothetical protein
MMRVRAILVMIFVYTIINWMITNI